MTEKNRGLLWNLLLYLAAFGIACVPYYMVEDLYLATGVFTLVATLVIFIVTCFYPDTSLYDPYWSVAPAVMVLLDMVRYHLWGINAWLVFVAVLIWAIRLTVNWAVTYHGLGHEDWRYRQYREKLSPVGFFFINLVGLQYVPTIVVYLALFAGLSAMEVPAFTVLSIPGFLLMLAAVLLEYAADREVHAFLRNSKERGRTCCTGVWRYSRHPNYLGEISFWTGMALFALPLVSGQWHRVLGFLSIVLLFNVVSIPMMERHNLERRTDYADYKAVTSRLLLLPPKKN